MGTKSAASYTKQPRKPSVYASAAIAMGNKATSPYFYGVVTGVDNESRRIVFDILSGQNIGPNQVGEAVPFYKDNLTLPQIGDIVPLLNGPSPESGILGEAESRTLFYLPPISVDQELAQNTIVRTSVLSPSSVNLLPSQDNYLAANNGFAFDNNLLIGAGTQFPGDDIQPPLEPNVSTYEALVISGLDDKDKKGYKKQEEQLQLFKNGFGINRNVSILRHNVSLDTITTFLRNNPNIPVFLFSKGCERAVEIMNSGLVAPSKLYIIEPYAVSSNTKTTVENAVRLYKVPMKNVFSGGYPEVGSVINVNGQKPIELTSAMGRTSHWAALTTVGKGYANGFIGFKLPSPSLPSTPGRTSTPNKPKINQNQPRASKD